VTEGNGKGTDDMFSNVAISSNGNLGKKVILYVSAAVLPVVFAFAVWMGNEDRKDIKDSIHQNTARSVQTDKEVAALSAELRTRLSNVESRLANLEKGQDEILKRLPSRRQ